MNSYRPYRTPGLRCLIQVSVALHCLVSAASAQTGVTTFHNDNARSGAYTQETFLSPSNVNPYVFGKLASVPVDGQLYAQPLFLPNVSIPNLGTRNVVYACTEHDSVYAIDADAGNGADHAVLWKTSFLSDGVTPVPQADVGANIGSIANEIGVTGTPVIDPDAGTLYVVAKTKETAGGTTRYVQRLHALDIATGAERTGSPVEIVASVPGTGFAGLDGVSDASPDGFVAFDARQHLQRPGLLLSKGVVYISWASHEDTVPYHGWIIGYDAKTLQQVAVFNTTPNGGLGGIWQGGMGLSADADGNIYTITGNGTFNPDRGCYGDSFLKLSPTNGLTVTDYFTPYNQSDLDTNDLDLGSTGAMLLPDQAGDHPHLAVGIGKDGVLYLVDRDNMGHYSPTDNLQIPQIMRDVPGGVIGSGACWNGRIYYESPGKPMMAFHVDNGHIDTTPESVGQVPYGYPNPNPTVSSNGNTNGIVWAIDAQGYGTSSPAILHAYDATNLAVELYNSAMAGFRDILGAGVKFTVPTIANGKVYVGTAGSLDILGMLAPRLVSVSCTDMNTVVATFDRGMDPASAQTATNYTVDNGLTVTSATLGSDGRTVTLTTSSLTPDTIYTLTVNGVTDTASPPNAVSWGSPQTFVYHSVYTMADAVQALSAAAGLSAAPAPLGRFDLVTSAPSDGRVDILDAIAIARAVLGTDTRQ